MVDLRLKKLVELSENADEANEYMNEYLGLENSAFKKKLDCLHEMFDVNILFRESGNLDENEILKDDYYALLTVIVNHS